MIPSWRRNYSRYRAYILNVIAHYKQRADVKAYLEILLSLATICIFAIFALKPTLITIAELMKEVDSKKATLSTMDQKIQDISNAQSLYDNQVNKIKLLEVAIPENPQPEVLVRQVEGLTVRHQTTLSTLGLGKAIILGEEITQPPQTETNEPLPGRASELSFSIGINADITQYSALFNFLSDLEKLRRPAKIDSLNLNSVKGKEENYLNLTVLGRLPYLKEKKENQLK